MRHKNEQSQAKHHRLTTTRAALVLYKFMIRQRYNCHKTATNNIINICPTRKKTRRITSFFPLRTNRTNTAYVFLNKSVCVRVWHSHGWMERQRVLNHFTFLYPSIYAHTHHTTTLSVFLFKVSLNINSLQSNEMSAVRFFVGLVKRHFFSHIRVFSSICLSIYYK